MDRNELVEKLKEVLNENIDISLDSIIHCNERMDITTIVNEDNVILTIYALHCARKCLKRETIFMQDRSLMSNDGKELSEGDLQFWIDNPMSWVNSFKDFVMNESDIIQDISDRDMQCLFYSPLEHSIYEANKHKKEISNDQ